MGSGSLAWSSPDTPEWISALEGLMLVVSIFIYLFVLIAGRNLN